MIAPVENQRSDADVALRRFRVQQSDDSRESMPLAALDSMRSVVARHPAIAMATAPRISSADTPSEKTSP